MPIFLRRDANNLGKHPREIIAVIDAYHRADLIDFEVCCLQELAGAVHFEPVEIVELHIPYRHGDDVRGVDAFLLSIIVSELFQIAE